jgi:hypothetical protein
MKIVGHSRVKIDPIIEKQEKHHHTKMMALSMLITFVSAAIGLYILNYVLR